MRRHDQVQRHRTGALRAGRRAFLAGAGGLIFPLPFLEALAPGGNRAEAVDTAAPKRFLVWHQGQGTVWDELARSGDGSADTTNVALGRIGEPLAAHQSRLLFLRGVDNKVYTISEGEVGHGRIENTVLNCRPALAADNPSGPSIDYEVWSRIHRPEHVEPLHLAIGPTNRLRRFTSGPGQALDSIGDLQRVLDSLTVAEGTGEELARLRARKQRVVDGVRENFVSFRARLGSEDRQRLDRHEQNLAELEKRLVDRASCQEPSLSGGDHFDESSEDALNVAVFILACDITPVVTLEYTEHNHPGAPFSDFASDYGGDWHDMVHKAARGEGSIITSRWFATRFARLLDKLGAASSGAGTLLDETLTLWTADYGDYPDTHAATSIHCVLAGAMGAAPMGRVLTLGSGDSTAWAMNNVAVSVLRAFGQSVDSFGYLGDTGVGPVSGGAIPGVMS
jgi:hypothetical protein